MPDIEELVMEEDYKILSERIGKLSFINGVSIYYDNSATERRRIAGSHNKCDTNFSLVTVDGKFISDTIAMRHSRFYNNIDINFYGLFKLTKKEQYDKPDVSVTSYIVDSEANFLHYFEFEKLISILTNRTKNYSPKEFIKIPSDLENSTFPVVNKYTNIWGIKPGQLDIEWDKERDDGLCFYSKEFSRRDSSYELEYVKDKYGNSLYLEEFYKGLIMLNNGSKFIRELIKRYLSAVDKQ